MDTDGIDEMVWHRLTREEEVFDEGRMFSVAVGGPGLVAVGWDYREGAADRRNLPPTSTTRPDTYPPRHLWRLPLRSRRPASAHRPH